MNYKPFAFLAFLSARPRRPGAGVRGRAPGAHLLSCHVSDVCIAQGGAQLTQDTAHSRGEIEKERH